MSYVSQQDRRIAVVILNWNGRDHLETYLPSVLEHTLQDAEVWVADNGSTDDSLAWLASNHPEVKTLALGRNWGFAEGYNKALFHVDADVHVLLNSDVRIVSRWVAPVLEVMDERGWSVASPLLVQDANPSLCEHAGAAGGWMDKDGFPFCLGRLFNEVEPVDAWHQQNREVFWASGAALFVRKSAWVEVGGLDGALFAHMEEIDLCWRLQSTGHRIGCVGQVSVQHLGGEPCELKPHEDLSEFPQQPHCDGQKPTWRLAIVCLPSNDVGRDCRVPNAVSRKMETILGGGKGPRRVLPRIAQGAATARHVAEAGKPEGRIGGVVEPKRDLGPLRPGGQSRTRLKIAPFRPRLNSVPTSVKWADTIALARHSLVRELDRCTQLGNVERSFLPRFTSSVACPDMGCPWNAAHVGPGHRVVSAGAVRSDGLGVWQLESDNVGVGYDLRRHRVSHCVVPRLQTHLHGFLRQVNATWGVFLSE